MSSRDQNNIDEPILLTIIHLFALVLSLGLVWWVLDSDVRKALAYLPQAQLKALSLGSSAVQRQAAIDWMGRIANYLVVEPTFWAWLGVSLVVSTALTGWAQASLTKSRASPVRCAVGILVWLLLSLAGALLLGTDRQPLSLIGLVLGFAGGLFLGWWVIVGYHRTNDRHTDARTVRAQLNFATRFQPEKYFDARKGVFVGMDNRGRAVYVPLAIAGSPRFQCNK